LLDARLALATWIQALIDQRSAYVLEDTQRTAELDQAARDHEERMISSYSPPLTADRTASSGSGPPTRLSTDAACLSAKRQRRLKLPVRVADMRDVGHHERELAP